MYALTDFPDDVQFSLYLQILLCKQKTFFSLNEAGAVTSKSTWIPKTLAPLWVRLHHLCWIYFWHTSPWHHLGQRSWECFHLDNKLQLGFYWLMPLVVSQSPINLIFCFWLDMWELLPDCLAGVNFMSLMAFVPCWLIVWNLRITGKQIVDRSLMCF